MNSGPVSAYAEPRLLIGGSWRTASDGRTLEVVDPATEQVIGAVPHATADDVAEALEAAVRGFEVWRATPSAERAEVIGGAARLLRDRREEIACTITREMGKPLVQSRAEVDLAAGHLQWNAEEGRRTYGRVISAAATRQQVAIREPIGPVAAFSGWNAAAVTPARKLGSALSAGCSVVLKASEETPATACALATALMDAGLPHGVVNLVFGDPEQISRQLISADAVRGVTFTGSTTVGKSLAALAGGLLKRFVMELGGHAPVVIGPDVSVEEVAESASRAAYRNAGQVCTSPTRFFVHQSQYQEFVEALSERVRALPVGSGFDENTYVGPVANERRLQAIAGLVDDAVRRGAGVSAGGRRLDRPGYFWAPTVLCDVDDDSEIANTEPFAPVALLSSWADVDEVVSRANRLPVGLAGYVFTGDHVLARRLALSLECGALALNGWQVSSPESPFGGWGDSGIGSEGGVEGTAAFQQIKVIDDQTDVRKASVA
jgi:succinate-semialdehyde dehydrogenase / glutarate-semialdehyde dehydrogenase